LTLRANRLRLVKSDRRDEATEQAEPLLELVGPDDRAARAIFAVLAVAGILGLALVALRLS
jgi:hypothetical protein